jgi:hypothetical protein
MTYQVEITDMAMMDVARAFAWLQLVSGGTATTPTREETRDVPYPL